MGKSVKSGHYQKIMLRMETLPSAMYLKKKVADGNTSKHDVFKEMAMDKRASKHDIFTEMVADGRASKGNIFTEKG